MYEWGRANVQHDKSIHQCTLCVCLKRAMVYVFMHGAGAVAPRHQEAGTALKTDAQDRSSPVQHTGVR